MLLYLLKQRFLCNELPTVLQGSLFYQQKSAGVSFLGDTPMPATVVPARAITAASQHDAVEQLIIQKRKLPAFLQGPKTTADVAGGATMPKAATNNLNDASKPVAGTNMKPSSATTAETATTNANNSGFNPIRPLQSSTTSTTAAATRPAV